jgi:hypothetical protein
MTEVNDNEKVHKLVDRALTASDSTDAMRFTQAALNAAHAMQVLRTGPWPAKPTS